MKRHRPLRPLVAHDGEDLRDDLPRFLHEHRVADADAGGLIDVLGDHGIIVEEVLNVVGRVHG